MPLVFIRHIGANLAYVQALDAVDPGFGQGGGVDPGYGIPDWAAGHPGNRPPGTGVNYPSQGLPGSPGHPDARPPSGPPPQVGPGEVLVLVRDPAGVWHYASLPSGSPPPKPVPVPPPLVPGMPLPPTAAPKQ